MARCDAAAAGRCSCCCCGCRARLRRRRDAAACAGRRRRAGAAALSAPTRPSARCTSPCHGRPCTRSFRCRAASPAVSTSPLGPDQAQVGDHRHRVGDGDHAVAATSTQSQATPAALAGVDGAPQTVCPHAGRFVAHRSTVCRGGRTAGGESRPACHNTVRPGAHGPGGRASCGGRSVLSLRCTAVSAQAAALDSCKPCQGACCARCVRPGSLEETDAARQATCRCSKRRTATSSGARWCGSPAPRVRHRGGDDRGRSSGRRAPSSSGGQHARRLTGRLPATRRRRSATR